MEPVDVVREEAMGKFDPREADARYNPFPSFAKWLAKSTVDSQRWERYADVIRKLRGSSPDLLPRALEVVKRAAAWDTGAIEGLYPTDRGFTLTVALEVTAWESLVEQKGPDARALFESQLNAYDYVLDFATRRVPVAEAWIRKLHEVVCQSQDTYEVQTPIGTQHHPLPKGEYKRSPNHVVQRDGSIHSWSPVDLTPEEMHRLCEELRTEAFNAAHPIVQSAYAHYAFVAVHPFADGNGRVARALASVFTYRAESIPLLILKGNVEYLPALEAADCDDFQRFVDFILERALDAIRLADESLRTAIAPSMQNKLTDLKSLYVTKGGYTHAEVDGAGYSFMEIFEQEIKRQMQDAAEKMKDGSGNSHLGFGVTVKLEGNQITRPTFRAPISDGPRLLHFFVTSASPANARVERAFALEVPEDCGREDDLIIQDLQADEVLEARVTELIPVPSAALQMRVSMAVERILGEAFAEMHSRAAETLRGRGY